MPRMQILNRQEQYRFDKPPLFDHIQRKQFFDFSHKLLNIAHNLKNPINQIGFLLLCGYFREAKRFFLPQDFHKRDIAVVAKILNYADLEFIASDYKKASRLRHQKIILEHYGFQVFNRKTQEIIKCEIDSMASHYLKPRLIFDRCSDILVQKRITIPDSGKICRLIRQSLQAQKY